MRVTQQMMINQVVGNLSSSLSRLTGLQSQLSSGRRIEKPSDDPLGVTRVLSYRSQLADIAQYQRNIRAGNSWLATAENALSGIDSLTQQAQEIATALSNDTYDQNARIAAAQEVRSLLKRMVADANTQIDNRYIFSGHKTRTAPFVASDEGVIYQGDQGVIEYQVSEQTRMQINQVGSETLLRPILTLGEKGDLAPGLSRDSLLTEINSGAGLDLGPPANGIFEITDNNSGITYSVDLSAVVTIGDAIDQITAAVPDITASISSAGNTIRLSPVAGPGGTITANTPLTNLNNGGGVETVPGTFHITNDTGTIDVEIDLSGTSTVGELITAFNTQLAGGGVANVTLAIDPAGTGLRLTDTNPGTLNLSVEDYDTQATADDLKISGYLGAQRDSGPLDPQVDFSVGESAGGVVAAELGLLGEFHTDFDGTDLDPILTRDVQVMDLDNLKGLTLGTLQIAQGNVIAMVDLSTAVTIGDVIDQINTAGLDLTASINDNQTGIQIVPNDHTRSLTVTDGDSTNTARALGIYGSPDLFGSMSLLVKALETNDREFIGEMIGGMSEANNQLLNERATVGAKIIRLETADDRLTETSLSVTALLSEVEDADLLQVTTELAGRQTSYQAALNAAARMLTPSLIDFLR